MEIFKEMQRHGILPNTITYSAFFSALEKGKHPEHARKIFKGMQHHGIVPDIITYNAVISALEMGKQSEQALDFSRKYSTMV